MSEIMLPEELHALLYQFAPAVKSTMKARIASLPLTLCIWWLPRYFCWLPRSWWSYSQLQILQSSSHGQEDHEGQEDSRITTVIMIRKTDFGILPLQVSSHLHFRIALSVTVLPSPMTATAYFFPCAYVFICLTLRSRTGSIRTTFIIYAN